MGRNEVSPGDRCTERRTGLRYRVREVNGGIIYLTDDHCRGWFGSMEYFRHDFEVDTATREETHEATGRHG
jgi:hypothetical protein